MINIRKFFRKVFKKKSKNKATVEHMYPSNLMQAIKMNGSISRQKDLISKKESDTNKDNERKRN